MSIEKFTVEELMGLNEKMIGRGMPTQDDGIGYNKADYGACSSYFYGASDAQLSDLAKRLVKYCNTQLDLDKDMMRATEFHYMEIAEAQGYSREDGISVDVTESGTLISFRYNEEYIEMIKKQPKRRWDGENKNWIVPNDKAVQTLNQLAEIGADIKNALEYLANSEIVKESAVEKVEVLTKYRDGKLLLKFPFDKEIVEAIKEIDIKDRKFNAKFKFWEIDTKYYDGLVNRLKLVADFRLIE